MNQPVYNIYILSNREGQILSIGKFSSPSQEEKLIDSQPGAVLMTVDSCETTADANRIIRALKIKHKMAKSYYKKPSVGVGTVTRMASFTDIHVPGDKNGFIRFVQTVNGFVVEKI